MDLNEVKNYALSENVPIIREQSGKLLQKVCRELSPRRILEIGTAVGYSALLMSGCCDAKITTIEKDEKSYNLALKNFDLAGKSGRIKAILGDAEEVLKSLLSAGERFDFVFLDGPKAQYLHYLPYIKTMLNVGGVLFADDIYFHGLVTSEEAPKHKNRSIVRNLRLFIEALKSDTDFESEFYDIEDGLSISKKVK